jgi:hypothetical protein
VTAVDLVSSGAPDARAPSVAAFKEAVGYSPPVVASAGVACAWPDPLTCPALQGGWAVVDDAWLAGPREARRRWRLERGDEHVSVTVHVASDSVVTAAERFLAIGSIHSSPEDVFRRPDTAPNGLLAALASTPERSRYHGVYANVVCEVDVADTTVDASAVAAFWHTEAASALVDDLSARLPEIGDRSVSPPSVRAGGEVDVTVGIPEKCEVVPIFDPTALRLLACEGGALTFLALRAGAQEVILVVIDPRTLLLSKVSVEVPVTG